MAKVNWNGAAVLARARLGLRRGLVDAAEDVRGEAVRLILSPPKSGRIYRRRSVTHQASAPGEAPAADTGRLANSITSDPVVERGTAMSVTVTARTAYAEFLEYGTTRMAARPYMRPALLARSRAIRRIVGNAVAAAVRGG